MINTFITLYVLKNIFLSHKRENHSTRLDFPEGFVELPFSLMDIHVFLLTLSLFHLKTLLLALILYDLHFFDNRAFSLKYKTREFECPRSIYFTGISIVFSFLSFSFRDPLVLLSVFVVPEFQLLLKFIKK